MVLLAIRTVSRLRCQSLRTLAAAAVSGEVSAEVLGDAPRDALPHCVGVQVKPGLDVRRELITDIAAEARGLPVAVIPEAFRSLRRGRDKAVPWTVGAAGIGLQPPEPEGAHIGRHPVRKRIAACCRHEIDGAAQRVGAELQGIGALVDRDIFVGGGIDFLEIAIAVGGVDRDPVHVELDATQMEVARQAGTTNRQPGVIAPFGLRKHARDVIQHILDGVGHGRVPVGLGRHDGDAAGCILNVLQRLLHGENRQRRPPRLIVRGGCRGGSADTGRPRRGRGAALRRAGCSCAPLLRGVDGNRRQRRLRTRLRSGGNGNDGGGGGQQEAARKHARHGMNTGHLTFLTPA